jgi:hypothetical protein
VTAGENGSGTGRRSTDARAISRGDAAPKKTSMADVAAPRSSVAATARARGDDVTPSSAADAAPPPRIDVVEARRRGEATPRAPLQSPSPQSTAQRFAPVRALAAAATDGRLSTDPATFRAQLNELYQGAVAELRQLHDGLGQHPDIEAKAQKVVDKAIERMTSSWTPAERQALHNVMNTVDQLAGGDRRFNHGDKMAVVQALLNDKCGILQMAHKAIDEKVPGLGNRIAHRAVDNAYTPTRRFERTGHAGPIQRMRDNRREKIEGIAAQEMHKALDKSLRDLGVDPATAQKLDGATRRLSIDQVMRMEGDIKLLQRKASSLGQGLGNDDSKRIVSELGRLARENIEVVKPPLRNGVPSPRSLDALIDTALDAADGLRLRPPR